MNENNRINIVDKYPCEWLWGYVGSSETAHAQDHVSCKWWKRESETANIDKCVQDEQTMCMRKYVLRISFGKWIFMSIQREERRNTIDLCCHIINKIKHKAQVFVRFTVSLCILKRERIENNTINIDYQGYALNCFEIKDCSVFLTM